MDWELIILLGVGFGVVHIGREIEKLARRLEDISDQIDTLQSEFDDKFGKNVNDHEFPR